MKCSISCIFNATNKTKLNNLSQRMMKPKILFLVLIALPIFANAGDQCSASKSDKNPYLLDYNCSFLNSTTFKSLVGFGGEWQQHLSGIETILSQDCLGIDKLVDSYVQTEANKHLAPYNSSIEIKNKNIDRATTQAIQAIYGN